VPGGTSPDTLHVTPAVERLVQRALDTDVSRRYKNAKDLLENLLEAFEDDRWEIADRGEVIKAAGLSRTDTNIDEATEDLLASLGNNAVQVTPMRPSVDRLAEAVAATRRNPTTGNRLDALLQDLDDSRELTAIDDREAFKRDPISELIQLDPRRKEAIIQARPRVPSLDDPDDETPLPPPSRHSDVEIERPASRPNTNDETAAMSALSGLDEPVRRVSTAAEQASVAAEKLEKAAQRAEAAADRAESKENRVRTPARPIARPNVAEIPDFEELPTPRLKSRALGIISLLIVIGGGIAFYMVYTDQQKQNAINEEKRQADIADAERRTKLASDAQADKGTLKVTSTPPDASIWLKLGRSGPGFRSLPLSSGMMHRIRIELDGYQPVDTEILAANWAGQNQDRLASVNVTLKAVGKDKKTGKSLAEPLPARPPNLAIEPKDFSPGEGPIRIDTSPPGAEVWLLIGYPNTGVAFPTVAGRDYELRALADGFKPGYAQVSAEEWRDDKPNIPMDQAKKKTVLEKSIELIADPDYQPPEKPKKGK
jgi:hypothetical protein